jgi:hypothetical protein
LIEESAQVYDRAALEDWRQFSLRRSRKTSFLRVRRKWFLAGRS